MNILDYVDENDECIGVAATYSDKALAAMAGRPEGGLAILWRKISPIKVNKIVIEKNFIVLYVNILGIDILFINVYLNSDNWEAVTQNKYLESLSNLEEILLDFNFDAVYFIGDFNADPLSGRAWRNLSIFMKNNMFDCFDVNVLPMDSFTFIGYGNSASRWLDHVVGRKHEKVILKDVVILKDIVGSDHLPLIVDFNIYHNNNCSNLRNNNYNIVRNNSFVQWKSLSEGELNEIDELVCDSLNEWQHHSLYGCSTTGCRHPHHLKLIDQFYNEICQSVLSASENYQKEFIKVNKYKVIPGWNRRVKELHLYARNCFLKWVKSGKNINSVEHAEMLQSRKTFKDSLKLCKKNKEREICQSIVEKFTMKNKCVFWKEVKKKRGKGKISNIIDGESCEKEIVNNFSNKFLHSVLPGDDDDDGEKEFLALFKANWSSSYKMNVRISPVSLRKALQSLNEGEGHDGIHSVFLTHSSDNFLTILSKFCNACFTHCYMPIKLLRGNINPIIKDKKGNISDSSNYRPVMQSSCILKLLEIHLLDILTEKITFNNRQFGFQKGISTSDACFILKEIIFKYSKNKGSGFLTFIDLSKAFDNVDHFLLGTKLLERGIPADIIYMLMHYLRNQYANVVWKEHKGRFCPVEKGVRQGGILSPLLFKLYVDSIITSVSDLDVGCVLGDTRVNILAYADDVVLITKSKYEMDEVYGKFCMELQKHKLQINISKTKCMVFGNPRNCQRESLRLCNDVIEIVHTYKYLGFMVSCNLQDKEDIELNLKHFYASSNSLFRNFKQVNTETLTFLFNSYSKPDYGLCLWNSVGTMRSKMFSTFEVAFSNALRRITGAPSYGSSHEAAETCNMLLLRHHLALVQARFYKRLMSSNCSLIKSSIYYLRSGHFFTHVYKLFSDKYNVSVTDNDFDILRARIYWVQRHETRRIPVVLPVNR